MIPLSRFPEQLISLSFLPISCGLMVMLVRSSPWRASKLGFSQVAQSAVSAFVSDAGRPDHRVGGRVGGSEALGMSEQDPWHLGGLWTGVHRVLRDLTRGSLRGNEVSASKSSLVSGRQWCPYAPLCPIPSQRIKERKNVNGPALEIKITALSSNIHGEAPDGMSVGHATFPFHCCPCPHTMSETVGHGCHPFPHYPSDLHLLFFLQVPTWCHTWCC